MKKNKYSSTPFFIELIIGMVVFIISSTILALVFTKATLLAKETRIKNLSVAEMYAVAEVIKAEGIDTIPTATKESDNSYWIYYDEDWQPTPTQGAYAVQIIFNPMQKKAGILTDLTLVTYQTSNNEEISRFFTGFYIPT